MMTSIKYRTGWFYRDGERGVCRSMWHNQLTPCIEMARLTLIRAAFGLVRGNHDHHHHHG